MPLLEIVRLEGAVRRIQHDLGVALKKQSEGAPGRADVDGLPQTVKHEHVVI